MKVEPAAVENDASTPETVTTKRKATWEALRQHPFFAKEIAEGRMFLASDLLRELSDRPA